MAEHITDPTPSQLIYSEKSPYSPSDIALVKIGVDSTPTAFVTVEAAMYQSDAAAGRFSSPKFNILFNYLSSL